MNDKVDVLKLMDYMIAQDGRLVGLYEARAAVAELIEACDYLKRDASNEQWAALHSALARVKGE